MEGSSQQSDDASHYSKRRGGAAFNDEEEMLFGDGHPTPRLQPSTHHRNMPESDVPSMASADGQRSDSPSTSQFRSKFMEKLEAPIKSVLTGMGNMKFARVSTLTDSCPSDCDLDDSMLKDPPEHMSLKDPPEALLQTDSPSLIRQNDDCTPRMHRMTRISECDNEVDCSKRDYITADVGGRGGSGAAKAVTDLADCFLNPDVYTAKVGCVPTATSDEHESLLRARMEKKVGNSAAKKPSSATAATGSDRYESALRAKIASEGNNNTARKPRPSDNDSTSDSYESKLRAKVARGAGQSAAHWHSAASEASTADDRYESALRSKMDSEGSDGAARKHSSSDDYSAGGRCDSKQSSSEATADDRYESALRAKIGRGGNNNTARKPRPSESDSASDSYESKVRAKMTRGAEKSAAHSHSASSEAAAAGGRYESTLRSKISSGGSDGAARRQSPSNDYSAGGRYDSKQSLSEATADDRYESALRAKIDSSGDINTARKPRTSVSDSASDSYESKVRAKVARGAEKSAAQWHSAASEASTADDRYESALRSKLNSGGVTTKHSSSDDYSAGGRYDSKQSSSEATADRSDLATQSTANDRYESALRAKVDSGGINSAARNQCAPVERKDFPRIAAKMEGYDMQDSELFSQNVKQSTPSQFLGAEERLRTKVESMDDGGVASFSQFLVEGKCNDILDYLQQHPDSSPAVLVTALEKLSESVISTHKIFNTSTDREMSGDVTRLRADWVDVLGTMMLDNSSAEAVQTSAMRTIWTIVAVDSRYATEFTAIDTGVDSLLMAMRTHRQANRIGSGLVAALAFNQSQATYISRFRHGAFVEQVCETLQSEKFSRDALKALFKLLLASYQTAMSSGQFNEIDKHHHLIETLGCYTNRERQGTDELINAVGTVLDVMGKSPKHDLVQMWGNWLLWLLLSHEKLLGISYDESRYSLCLLISSILNQLDATTADPKTPLAVHESTICLLSTISCCTDDVLAGNDNTIYRIAVAAMLAQPKSRTIAIHGCNCIGNRLYMQDDTSSVLLRAIAGVDDEAAADISMNSIALLAKKGFEQVVSLLQHDNLINAVVGCMGRYPQSASIQTAACDILTSIALDRRIMSQICSCGGASGILSALCNLADDPIAVCKGFVALAHLNSMCDTAILQRHRSPETILHAMKTHEANLSVQMLGAAVIWNLSSCHSILKNDIVQLGGVQIISEAMERFIASSQLQEKGIIAIWALSSVPIDATIATGAIRAITRAVAAHLPIARICEHGLGALSVLATSKALLDDADFVIDLITSSMWMHSENATVQQGAIASLIKISLDKPTNQVLQITPNDLDAITNAMRTHLFAKDVQENAFILLRGLSFCSSNVTIMRGNPSLVGLIKTGLSNFHGQLRMNVDDLLHNLLPGDSR